MAPRGPQEGPRRPQDCPKTAPAAAKRPKMAPMGAQERPKMPPDGFQSVLQGPQDGPKTNLAKIETQKNVLRIPSARDLKVSSMAFLRVP